MSHKVEIKKETSLKKDDAEVGVMQVQITLGQSSVSLEAEHCLEKQSSPSVDPERLLSFSKQLSRDSNANMLAEKERCGDYKI